MSSSDLESNEEPQVRAAAGRAARPGDGGVEIAVIHRPKYSDWTLPKGKLEPGEDFEQAAAARGRGGDRHARRAGARAEPVSYRDRKGRSKVVRYWLMRPLDGEFQPGSEVDELRWLDPEAAQELLSYEHDAELVREAILDR